MATIRWPSIADVAKQLRQLNAYLPHDPDEIDIRLQVHESGWALRFGLSDYDLDHSGYWGAGSVPGGRRRFNSRAVAKDLLDQAKDDFASS